MNKEETHGITNIPSSINTQNNIQPKHPLITTESGILDQARLRPLGTSLESSIGGKITTTLIKLKGSGLSECLNNNARWVRDKSVR